MVIEVTVNGMMGREEFFMQFNDGAIKNDG